MCNDRFVAHRAFAPVALLSSYLKVCARAMFKFIVKRQFFLIQLQSKYSWLPNILSEAEQNNSRTFAKINFVSIISFICSFDLQFYYVYLFKLSIAYFTD